MLNLTQHISVWKSLIMAHCVVTFHHSTQYFCPISFEKCNTKENKAGYTATSCGRVGKGGNARFPSFQLDHYGPTDRRTDGRNDEPMDGRTDKASFRVACPQLKKGKQKWSDEDLIVTTWPVAISIQFLFKLPFLVAETQRYKRLCPSVCWSIRPSVNSSVMIESEIVKTRI